MSCRHVRFAALTLSACLLTVPAFAQGGGGGGGGAGGGGAAGGSAGATGGAAGGIGAGGVGTGIGASGVGPGTGAGAGTTGTTGAATGSATGTAPGSTSVPGAGLTNTSPGGAGTTPSGSTINPTGPAPNQSTTGVTPGPVPGQNSVNPTGPNPTQTAPGVGGGRQGAIQIQPSPGLNGQGSATSGLSTGTGGRARSDVQTNYDACVKSWDRDTHMSRSEYTNVCKRLRRADEEFMRTHGGTASAQ